MKNHDYFRLGSRRMIFNRIAILNFGVGLSLLLAIIGSSPLSAKVNRQQGDNEQPRILLPLISAGGIQIAQKPSTAVNDTYQAVEDSVLAVNAQQGLLTNDINCTPGELRAILVTDAMHGDFELGGQRRL